MLVFAGFKIVQQSIPAPAPRKIKAMKQPKAENARILDALKKASAEAKQRAMTDGVPFVGGRKKTWSVTHGTTLRLSPRIYSGV